MLYAIADLSDDARNIESEDRRQARERQFGKPVAPAGEHIPQVRHDAAGLDFDEYVGRSWLGHGNALQLHFTAEFMEPRREHRLHGRLLPSRLSGLPQAAANG
jgi:hypothetical protein